MFDVRCAGWLVAGCALVSVGCATSASIGGVADGDASEGGAVVGGDSGVAEATADVQDLDAASCGFTSAVTVCNDCLVTSCCDVAYKCAVSADCSNLYDCLATAVTQDDIDACSNEYPGGVTKYNDFANCMTPTCDSACGADAG